MELVARPAPDQFNFVVTTHTGVRYVETSPTEAHPAPKAEGTFTVADSGRLVKAYVQSFNEVFTSYNGPDEPPGFEPEDYPVR